MAMEIVNNYSSYFSKNSLEETKEKEKSKTSETEKSSKGDNRSDYLKKLQKQVPYMKLETGWGLSMEKDNRRGVLTVNPKLLEKMQNDPEAEKKYTQLMKDIERAEKITDAYFNALGGCVEYTSHTYIDENGKYYHFAYIRRDDKLNEKLREEASENAEKLVEKTREKAKEKKEEVQEALEEKKDEKEETAVPDKAEQLLDKKLEESKDGSILLYQTDLETILDAIREKEGEADTEKTKVGANLDLQA